jgi:tetratricopeptide (TPR) repeat protein
MGRHRALLLLSAFAVALPAHAQNPPAKPRQPPANAPADPKPAAAPRVAPTFAALHVGAEELPAGWTFEKELATVSPQPRSLFEDDIYSQILPKAKRQDFQTIAGPKTRGSILYFDWGEKIPEAAEEFIPELLFGEKGEKATRIHPEQIVRVGGVMLIVSFPLDSEERKWVIERLRRRFGLRLAHGFGPEKPLLATLAGHYEKETVEEATAGLAFAAEHEKELATVSFAAFLEGELATTAKEWPRAEKAYSRALALDATSDTFDHDGLYWAAKDGHGYALYGQKKYEDAARELREAAKIAADLKRPEDQGHCLYNVACCLALSKRGDEAIATLKESIALQPKGREDAAKDEDFASIATRPEFQALLK